MTDYEGFGKSYIIVLAMPYDFKKSQKELYQPKAQPTLIIVPEINYLAVRGKGDPNEEDGDYQTALGLLYSVAYTLKMSYKSERQIPGFFEYVVPPLEGLWWQSNTSEIDYEHKENFNFISLIRLPDFVTKADFDWAITEAAKKKKQDFSRVEFFTLDEGLCAQCLHLGSYDDEPTTIAKMHEFIRKNGYILDISELRRHHEIYLSDPRKTAPEKLKTVIRLPIKRA